MVRVDIDEHHVGDGASYGPLAQERHKAAGHLPGQEGVLAKRDP